MTAVIGTSARVSGVEARLSGHQSRELHTSLPHSRQQR